MMTETEGKRKRERVNATNRLYKYLAAVASTSPTASTPLIEVMATALGLPRESPAKHECQAYTAIVDLLQRSETEIRAFLPQEVSFCLRSFEPLYMFFSPRTCMIPWQQVRVNLRERYIADIENTAHRLTGLIPELTLEDEDFIEVRNSLSVLHETLLNASLKEDVRTVLLARFKEVERSFDNYGHVGAPGIKEALEKAVGTMAADAHVWTELKRDEGDGGILLKLISKVAIATLWVLTAANTVHDAQKNFAPVMHQLFLEAPAQDPHTQELLLTRLS